MEKISATEFKKILAKCEGKKIGDFPKDLRDYLSK